MQQHSIVGDNLYHNTIIKKILNYCLSCQMSNFNKILKILGEYLQVDRAFILSLYDNQKRFDEINEWTARGIKSNKDKLQNKSYTQFPWLINKFKQGETVIIDSVQESNIPILVKNKLINLDVSAVFYVPVMDENERPLGIIGVSKTKKTHNWNNKEVEIMKIVARILNSYWEQNLTDIRYRNLFQNLGDAISIFNDDGLIIEINKKFASLAGYSKGEIEGKKKIKDFIYKDDWERINKYHKKRLINRNVPSNYKFKFVNSKELTRNIDVSVSLIPGSSNRISVLKDINMTKKITTDSEESINNFHENLIYAITNMLEIHDKYTEGHSENVAKVAVKIARKMGYSNYDINRIYWAGMVHDIGKILIPNNILNKKGSLTKEEFAEMKKHPLWGYKTLNNFTQLKDIAKYILHHHERWDGNGYPAGLKKDEIPHFSQILAVADAWDAMSSDRSYRKALSSEKAIMELKKNKGTQFSPAVVDVFTSIVS